MNGRPNNFTALYSKQCNASTPDNNECSVEVQQQVVAKAVFKRTNKAARQLLCAYDCVQDPIIYAMRLGSA